jgi:hypothetical protein
LPRRPATAPQRPSQARDHKAQPELDAAISRLLDHYLHTAARASDLLSPAREELPLAPLSPGAAPGQPADRRQALAWFDAERHVLLAEAPACARKP